MIVKATTAKAMGSHPPVPILATLAKKKPRSTTRNAPTSGTTAYRGQRKVRLAATKNKIEVSTIVPVTAMP